MRNVLASRINVLTPEERNYLLQAIPPQAQQLLLKAFPEAGGLISGAQQMAGGGAIHGGGGLDDLVPATIDGKAPARLSGGEFVMPADVVSGMGDGNTDEGVRKLHNVIRKVRQTKGMPMNPRKMPMDGLNGLMMGRM